MVVFHHFMQSFFAFQSESFVGRFFSQYGNFGVDVFFVLSGCVMYLSVRKRRDAQGSFLLERLFRIVPIYWFYTAVMVVAVELMPRAFAYTHATFGSVLCSLVFFPCINPSGLGYFPLLTVGWTLNFEMFFYLVLAICVAVVQRYAILVCVLVMLALPEFTPATWAYAPVLKNTLLREFVAGMTLGWIWFGGADKFCAALPRWVSIASSAVAFFFAIYAYRSGWQSSQLVLASIVVWCALVFESAGPTLPSQWKRWGGHLGDVSYSTYLSHAIVIGLFLHVIGAKPQGGMLVLALAGVICATYLISLGSYRWVETNNGLRTVRQKLQAKLPPRCP